ncbi:MAG: hypothetical protein AABX33_07590 [Nanoarchaeota archaeon]
MKVIPGYELMYSTPYGDNLLSGPRVTVRLPLAYLIEADRLWQETVRAFCQVSGTPPQSIDDLAIAVRPNKRRQNGGQPWGRAYITAKVPKRTPNASAQPEAQFGERFGEELKSAFMEMY